MSLEVSEAKYNNDTMYVQRSNSSQESGANHINISEAPAQTGVNNKPIDYNQEKGQKDTFSEQQIKDAIFKANSKMRYHRTKVEFSYHEETKRVSIKVMDKDTEEVIREIPPEETLEMIEKMWELAGLLVDERR